MYPAGRDDILKGLENLISFMEKSLDAAIKSDEDPGNTQEISQEDKEKLMTVRFKLLKGVVMQVDNSLGDLQDLLDTMEYHQDEKLPDAKRLVNRLEEEASSIIDYLRRHNQY